MLIRNSSELSTDPLGTPARIDFIEEAKDYSVTFCRLYYLNSYLSIEVTFPRCHFFLI